MSKFGDFTCLPEHEPMVYVVYQKYTLGYLYRIGESIYLSVMACKGGRGHHWQSTSYLQLLWPHASDDCREATLQDFKEFRMSPRGHLVPVD